MVCFPIEYANELSNPTLLAGLRTILLEVLFIPVCVNGNIGLSLHARPFSLHPEGMIHTRAGVVVPTPLYYTRYQLLLK